MNDAYAKPNRFEQIIHKDNWPGDRGHTREAVRDVGDTMCACREWFEAYKVLYTGADVVAMASLALKRERDRWAEEVETRRIEASRR